MVSNYGRVKRIKRGPATQVGRILKPINRGPYLAVTLFDENGPKMHSVHRLVATAFHKNSQNKPMVNHKDGNKHNNAASNLEWVTAQENNRHAADTGLGRWWIGLEKATEVNKKPVLCVETGEKYSSLREAAKKTGIHETGICHACRDGRRAGGYRWRHL